ncbi:MAG TPA: hypothetical protein VKA84_18075 [Gemmatimonadaceae bacterium]|nr:hypothetical protein [Gemmatimonadaceae bacterium]
MPCRCRTLVALVSALVLLLAACRHAIGLASSGTAGARSHQIEPPGAWVDERG